MRIGIDVGGTHTDAVILNGDDIIAATKSLTTADVISGVCDALDTILADSGVQASDIDIVMIGTTQFTNAVIERRELAPVAAIRIGLPRRLGAGAHGDARLAGRYRCSRASTDKHAARWIPVRRSAAGRARSQ